MLLSTVTIFVPVFTAVTVEIPVVERDALPLRTSPVLIPTTESKVIVLIPTATGCITVLELVTSPTCKIGSFTVFCVELICVVVPSI